MLKWVQCVRRRPELTVVEFRRQWQEYGEEIVSLGAELGAVRVEVSAALVVDANVEWQLQSRLGGPLRRPRRDPLLRERPGVLRGPRSAGAEGARRPAPAASGGLRRRSPLLLLPRLAGRGSLVLPRRRLTTSYSAASIGTKLPSSVPAPPGDRAVVDDGVREEALVPRRRGRPSRSPPAARTRAGPGPPGPTPPVRGRRRARSRPSGRPPPRRPRSGASRSPRPRPRSRARGSSSRRRPGGGRRATPRGTRTRPRPRPG